MVKKEKQLENKILLGLPNHPVNISMDIILGLLKLNYQDPSKTHSSPFLLSFTCTQDPVLTYFIGQT